MRVLGLFDGISTGFLALNKLGIEVEKYYSSEIDDTAAAITKYNFPNIEHVGSILNLSNEKLNNLGKIDLLIGGFPCQPFSSTGKILGFDDERGKLFFELVRVFNFLKEKNPNLKFLFENVKMKKGFSSIITNIIGVQPIEINSKHFSPQNRPRLYWTNILINKYEGYNSLIINDILEEDVDVSYNISTKGIIGKLKSNYKDRKPYTIFGKCGTLKLGGDVKCIVKDYEYWKILKDGDDADFERLGMRNLTPLEYERLQTLPDNFTKYGLFNDKIKEIPKTKRYYKVGNGWTLDVIKYLFKNLK